MCPTVARPDAPSVSEVLGEALEDLGLSLRALAKLAANDGTPSVESNRRLLRRWLLGQTPQLEVAERFVPFLGKHGSEFIDAVKRANAARSSAARADELRQVQDELRDLRKQFDDLASLVRGRAPKRRTD